MKLTVLAENLNRGLAIVGRSVASRPQLPVLSNVLLVAKKNGLELLTTDLEMSFRVKVGAKVAEEGEISIPAKVLSEFVATIPVGTVELATEGEGLRVVSGGIKAKFAGIGGGEFPAVPEFKGEGELVIAGEELVKKMGRVGMAAARDDSRPVLTGILWKFGKKGVEMAATDGYRLSTDLLKAEMKSQKKMGDLIVPARALVELSRVVDKDEKAKVEVKVDEEKQQVVFRLGQVELVSRLLTGEFPPFGQIVPESFSSRAVMDKEELIEAVRRAAIFARDAANIVKLAWEEKGLAVAANSSQVGEGESQVEAELEGEKVEVAFNSRYLLEYLGAVEEERVVFESEGALKPGVFKLEKESFLHVIMPVRVQS